MEKSITTRKGEWFCTVETPSFVKEYGPFSTREEAIEFRNQPFSIMNGLSHEQSLLVESYREIFQRVNVDDLTLAKAVQVMTKTGISQAALAHYLGRKQTWISFMFRLSMIPKSLLFYQQKKIVGTTALVKSVDKLGPIETERRIRSILSKRHNVMSKITERELLAPSNTKLP